MDLRTVEVLRRQGGVEKGETAVKISHDKRMKKKERKITPSKNTTFSIFAYMLTYIDLFRVFYSKLSSMDIDE